MKLTAAFPTLLLLWQLPGSVLAQQPPPTLSALPWLGFDPRAPSDRGRGVVAFSHEPVAAGVVDSLPLRTRATPDAPVQAYFLQRSQPDSSPYALVAPAGVSANLLEFEYEIVGLPVDSVDPHRAWARVIYAFDAGHHPQLAWASLDSTLARLVLWTELLPTQDLFLTDSVPWTFYDQPAGSPIPIPRPQDPHAYVLQPLATRGSWLQVRVMLGDSCDQSPSPSDTAVAWVQYLDAMGRPRVWYYPRGC